MADDVTGRCMAVQKLMIAREHECDRRARREGYTRIGRVCEDEGGGVVSGELKEGGRREESLCVCPFPGGGLANPVA